MLGKNNISGAWSSFSILWPHIYIYIIYYIYISYIIYIIYYIYHILYIYGHNYGSYQFISYHIPHFQTRAFWICSETPHPGGVASKQWVPLVPLVCWAQFPERLGTGRHYGCHLSGGHRWSHKKGEHRSSIDFLDVFIHFAGFELDVRQSVRQCIRVFWLDGFIIIHNNHVLPRINWIAKYHSQSFHKHKWVTRMPGTLRIARRWCITMVQVCLRVLERPAAWPMFSPGSRAGPRCSKWQKHTKTHLGWKWAVPSTVPSFEHTSPQICIRIPDMYKYLLGIHSFYAARHPFCRTVCPSKSANWMLVRIFVKNPGEQWP